MTPPHVAEALEAELAAPAPPADGRAEAAALAAVTTALFIGSSHLVPVAGPIAVAATVAAFAPSFRRDGQIELREEIKTQVQEALDRELSSRVLPGMPDDPAVKAWQSFLPWDELRAGKEVEVPVGCVDGVCHPIRAGFTHTRLASRVGQVADWACPLPDGSRLHAHEYADGRITLHRDALDPGQGVGTAVIHYMAEAREGQILTVLLAAGLIAAGAALVNRGLL